MSYARPHYLRDCLKTLAANDLSDCKVHLWQDGTRGAVPYVDDDQPGIAGSIKVFEDAPIADKELHAADHNLCCAGQRYRIMPYMAAHYERFICMDGDIILSPWCITHIKTLLEQYKDDTRWCSVMPSYRAHYPAGQEYAYRDKVMPANNAHLWCEGYWTDRWARMWPWYEQYYGRVRYHDYRAINDLRDEIRQWSIEVGCTDETLGPSSDEALHRARQLEGYQRLKLCVNRATGIGENGLHCYPDLIRALGVYMQPIHQWDDEDSIKRFELVEGQD
jgi:hypothetical protein